MAALKFWFREDRIIFFSSYGYWSRERLFDDYLSPRFWCLSCLHAFDDYLVFILLASILSSRFWRLSCVHSFGVYLVFTLLVFILSSRF